MLSDSVFPIAIFYALFVLCLVVHGPAVRDVNKNHKKSLEKGEASNVPAVLPFPSIPLGLRKAPKHFHFNFSSNISFIKNLQTIDKDALIHQLSTLTPMLMDELQPPDHMDGVRVEQDGDLNTKYRKEILIGDHGEFDSNVGVEAEVKMKEIFYLVDVNKDDLIDTEELNGWMIKKVKEHLEEAKKDNDDVFEHLDINKDGNVTWTEFSIHFFLAKGYSLEKAVSLSAAGLYEDIAISPEEKEKLIRYKFRWAEADEGNIDEQLDKTEMMNFRHPEQSPSMIQRLVMDLLENLDINADGIISEHEFVNLPSKYMGDDLPEVQKKERTNEFNNYIDLNGDGIVTLDELKVYVDPKNLKRLKTEAENLISLADEDSDNRLSLKEVLENSELFLGSKMFDASRNFHDEF